ncbi:glycosyltransferase family 2 protein [Patescibacteria group bacterium]|nr:glycosyltransferase family 2 protein [Patescibacteria group bacterium]
MRNKKVVIVMPAYFAEKTVERTYRDVPEEFKKNIILVDDASRDKTVEAAKKLGIKVFVHKKNLGYGGNQKTCYTKALEEGADIVVMIHPDYQYDATMTKELIRPLQDGWLDIMMGNRIRSRAEALAGGMPIYKYYSNRFLTLLENLVLGLNLGEYHTGFRAYTKEVLQTLPYKCFSNDFIFDQEILISAVHGGFKMGEIPMPVRYFPEASSINFKRSFKYGVETLTTLVKYILDKSEVRKYPIFNHRSAKH